MVWVLNLALTFNNYYCSFEKLCWALHKKVKQEGKWNQTVSYTCFWDCYWRCASHLLANFLPVTSNWVPEVLTECGFLFVTKVTSIQVGHIAAAQKLKANWYATPNQKTMVNNELPLSKRTNQERPYKQLLYYRSRHLQVGPEQFCTSLFNQKSWCLGVFPWAISSPETSKGFLTPTKTTFPLPRLGIQWNMYFTEAILEDGDDSKPGRGLSWNYLMILNLIPS